MLYVHVVKPEKCIIAVDMYFKSYKKKFWFDMPEVVSVIKEIDKTEVVEGDLLRSPVFGLMSADGLSTGCKAVILTLVQSDAVVRASGCGDNCGAPLYELSKTRDIHIWLQYTMDFPYDVELIFPDSGFHAHNRPEYVDEMIRIKEEFR